MGLYLHPLNETELLVSGVKKSLFKILQKYFFKSVAGIKNGFIFAPRFGKRFF